MSDLVSEYANKAYRNNEKYTHVALAYIQSYMKHLNKKMEGKDDAIRAVMAGTNTVGMQVLSRLQGVGLTDSVMSVYVYCKDEGFRYIAKQFEAAIELAILKPEKFLFGLHGFYNNLASKLRKDSASMMTFMQFLGRFMELRYRKSDGSNINPNVVLAYTDLLLQSLDYLRPNKYDRATTVCGVTVSGEPILTENPFPWVNLAEWDHAIGLLSYEPCCDFDDLSIYRRYGFPDSTSMAAIKDHFRMTRIFQNSCAILIPFINEYTYDIVPQGMQTGRFYRWGLMHFDVDAELLEAKLSSERRRTLPVNGVRVDFEDETLQITSLLMKEIFLDNTIYLLYKLTTAEGEYSGFFRPRDSFFSSSAMETEENMHSLFRCIVEYFYASAVLDGDYTDENCCAVFRNFIFPISAKSHMLEGPLRDVYHNASSSHVAETPASCVPSLASINGTIIKVDDASQISEADKKYANSLGFSLAKNEVYRPSEISTVFSLRDYTPPVDENAGLQYSGKEGWLQDD